MPGVEGYRPRPKEAKFDAGQPGGGSSGNEPPEIHYGGTPVVKPEFRDGKPVSVTHLYMDRRGGQFRWWTEQESLAAWGERVEAARERKDQRYESTSADHIPSTVAHTYNDGRSGDYMTIHYSHETPHQRIRSTQASARYSASQRESASGQRDRQETRQQDRYEENRSSPDGEDEQANTSGERGTTYESIGLSSAEFKARVAEVRELLRAERLRYGEGFNEAEYLRGRIDQDIRHLVDNDLDREDDLIELYGDLYWGWDIMAFNRYSPQTQRMALEQEESLQKYLERGVLVRKKAAAMLDMIATAIDLPHIPGQQVDNRQADIMSIFGVEQKERDHWIKPL